MKRIIINAIPYFFMLLAIWLVIGIVWRVSAQNPKNLLVTLYEDGKPVRQWAWVTDYRIEGHCVILYQGGPIVCGDVVVEPMPR